MSWWSKIREALAGLKAGRVTRPYPLGPDDLPARFRGRPVFDPAKCIGCGGCANNCPAREILLHDPSQEIRIVKYIGRRCTYCGRCADLCPEGAITMSRLFETATDAIGDLRQEIWVFMGTCQRCGRCFKHAGPLEDLMVKGYRCDDLGKDLWVREGRMFLEKDALVRDIDIELD